MNAETLLQMPAHTVVDTFAGMSDEEFARITSPIVDELAKRDEPELAELRRTQSKDIEGRRIVIRLVTEAHKRHLLAQQIADRYGEAGKALLAIMPPEKAREALLAQKAPSNGTVIPVEGVAGTTLELKPPTLAGQ